MANGLDVGEREPWEDFHMCCLSSPRVGAGTKVMKRCFMRTQRAVMSKTSRPGAALPVALSSAEILPLATSKGFSPFHSELMQNRENMVLRFGSTDSSGAELRERLNLNNLWGGQSFLFPFILLGPWMGLNNETREQEKSI